jgi:hypothetical protein
LGNADRKKGELETFGINLGFNWKNVIDEPKKWEVMLSNDITESDMTVDITPRRCQKFKAMPAEEFRWTNSAGGSGTVIADENGLVTIKNTKIKPNEYTTLSILKHDAN